MNTEIRSVRFMLVWFVAGITAVPTALALSVAAILSLQTVIEELLAASRLDYWGDYGPIGMAVCLLILGFCIGTLQKGVVRRHLALEIRRLGLYSAFGSLLAGFVFILFADSFGSIGCCGEYDLLSTLKFGLAIATYLGILSSVQTLALRSYFRRNRLWVLAHLAAIALASAIVLAGRLAFPTPYDNVIVHLVVGAPIAALFTGLVMRHLVLHQRRTDKDKRGDGPAQPAPATDGTPPTRSSVWDDAV